MKKWNSLAGAGIVFLLILGYGIPAFVMDVEDDGRKLELKSYEIEEIELNFQNVNIEEEMAVFPDMLLNNIVVERGDASIKIRKDGDNQETQENEQSVLVNKDSVWIENSIDAFLQIFHLRSNIEFVDFKATYYVMMASQEDESVYPVWECYGVDIEKREYRFWLDDISGTVLAFEIPYEIIGVTDKELNNFMECLGEYYGYEIYGLAESIYDVYQKESWENAFVLFDEEENISNFIYVFKIGDRLLFNMYPGSVSFYSDGYSETE